MKNFSLKVSFDVDGTLIHQVGEKEDTPRYDVIAIYNQLELLGCDLYAWSGGGVDYATRWVRKLGLNAKVVAKGSFRPDICFDDEIVNLADKNIRV